MNKISDFVGKPAIMGPEILRKELNWDLGISGYE